MYTTALGLAVAIPAMVAFSFLTSRQNQLLEELAEKCSKLTETLTSSHISGLDKDHVFPTGQVATGNPVVPPSYKAS
jgi:hypothetical protein